MGLKDRASLRRLRPADPPEIQYCNHKARPKAGLYDCGTSLTFVTNLRRWLCLVCFRRTYKCNISRSVRQSWTKQSFYKMVHLKIRIFDRMLLRTVFYELSFRKKYPRPQKFDILSRLHDTLDYFRIDDKDCWIWCEYRLLQPYLHRLKNTINLVVVSSYVNMNISPIELTF